MVLLETERLILRPWRTTDDDVDFAYDLYSRWDVQRYIGRVPRVIADRAEAVSRVTRYAAEESSATRGISVVERTDTGAPIGVLLLKSIPASGPTEPLEASGDIEIGWHFHPDQWGHGFASEAARAVLERALAAGLPRVVAVTSPANAASQRVCLRLGMRHLGVSGDYYNTDCELFVTP